MTDEQKDVEWGPCCFCGEAIAPMFPDPLSLTVATSDGKWQIWFTHAQCFKARLVDPPDAFGFFEPAHF
ncbi:hypothetical protein AB4Z52_35420 [Rhizobium sp. 2YAF20]|uniref:hypothetical protein n=1 Tax=Rhizobium sp. 2YAF20 TaxID=3233027 RepID=UPI003F95A88C